MNSVAIVGVGLIGGSFALALRSAGFSGKIVGVSSHPAIREALELNIIDSAEPLDKAVPQADLVYLAQPIGRILDTLHHLEPLVRPDALVTDAGSTKQAIVSTARATLRSCQFLGGHPLAGKEIRGAAAADADLFRGRPYVLTPAHPDDLRTPAAAAFLEVIRNIGAHRVVLGAEEHDRLVAFSSHVPQLASTALAAAIAEHSPESSRVAGPGLLDTTRLALSSYDLWRDIVATNTVEIEDALTAYIQKLEYLRENLRTRQLQEEFATAAKYARTLRGS
ncbi:MAG: prephenate dehydrogenase [Bryobacterales bacterium]|nr:prephenate dehydrogenase [Bryobacterales bacterium]